MLPMQEYEKRRSGLRPAPGKKILLAGVDFPYPQDPGLMAMDLRRGKKTPTVSPPQNQPPCPDRSPTIILRFVALVCGLSSTVAEP